MYRSMSNADETEALSLAVYTPELFGAMTPGQFANKFGVPSRDQWELLNEVLVYDERGKFRSVRPCMAA